MAVLTLQAVACIAVIIDRLVMLALSRARTREFVETAGAQGSGVSAERLLKLAEHSKGSHLASFLANGLRAYVDLKQKGHGGERAAELTRRALERKAGPLSRDLSRGTNVLASTGSTAPFVGLLGTVLGIMHAFKLIQTGGSGGIHPDAEAEGKTDPYTLSVTPDGVVYFEKEPLAADELEQTSRRANTSRRLVLRADRAPPYASCSRCVRVLASRSADARELARAGRRRVMNIGENAAWE